MYYVAENGVPVSRSLPHNDAIAKYAYLAWSGHQNLSILMTTGTSLGLIPMSEEAIAHAYLEHRYRETNGLEHPSIPLIPL
jgi:hypothetical protein